MKTRGPTTIACALILLAAPASAQELKDTPGPIEQVAHRVSGDNPIPRVTLMVQPAYPVEAQVIEASARVVLYVTVSDIGRVVELRRSPRPQLVFSGVPRDAQQLRAAGDALVAAAADAVRQWQYRVPARAPIVFSVVIDFAPGGDASVRASSEVAGSRRAVEPERDPNTAAEGRKGAIALLETIPPEWEGDGAVMVGGGISMPQKIRHEAPVYPAEARAAGVADFVILHILIGTDGRVMKTRILRSVPLLDEAAIAAVRQWQFAPKIVDGRAVPVIAPVTINFPLP